MKNKTVSMFFPKENVQSLLGLKGRLGGLAANVVMAVTGLHKANRVLAPLDGLKGKEFAQASLDVLGVNAVVSEADLKNVPLEGPCIICSNHPFGGVDGLMMLATLGKLRKDVLLMTNYILSGIPSLADNVVSVDPFAKGRPRSVSGAIHSLNHLRRGGCLVLFPAGEVSSNRNPERVVKDAAWQNGAMRLIRAAGVPVIPAFFSGENSKLFHALGAIHPILRTMRLPWEMLNKSGQTLHLKFGTAVKAVEFPSYPTPEELGAYLRNRTYALEGLLHSEERPVVLQNQHPVEAHVDTEILKAELAVQEKNILYRESGYTCYLCSSTEIPNMLHEIGVCREETFRNNGEGTGRSIDLDKYDGYYLQMFLWNDEACELVGAYRIGLGNEIMAKYGICGFYTDTTFHFKEAMAPLLEKTMELGRSFIRDKYQQVPIVLRLLLIKGIGRVMKKYSNLAYFIGTASISSSMPPLFSSLVVEYIERTFPNTEYQGLIEPEKPFTLVFHKVDVAAIGLEKMTIDQFDRTLKRYSSGKYRIPPLVRAYFKLNATCVGFNVDSDFNNCVDALVLAAVDNLPVDVWEPYI